MTDKIVAANRRKKLIAVVVGPASFVGLVLWLAHTLLYGERAAEPAMVVLLFFVIIGLNLSAPAFLRMVVRGACVMSWIWFVVGVLFTGATVFHLVVALFGLALFLAIPER